MTGTGRAGWLTRRQVAQILGIDERQVAQMDGRDQFFSKGWGSKPQKEAEAMRAEVKAVLRPHAQLTGGEPVAPAIAVQSAPDGKPAQLPPVTPTAGKPQ